nr:unnamed protein product [Digitaria exilis]
MEGKGDEEVGAGEPSSSAGSGGELDLPAETTESLASMVNLEWGNAACSEESVEKWTAADVFHPGELVECRVPTKDDTPSPSILGDQFVILSLNHIMCGLRMDASDFMVSVLAHYGIEWSHLTPNSITALSIFAHLCEAYLGVPPTVEVFAHFYRLYRNKKGETDTLGGVYFRLRDKMKRNYPVYYLRASQFVWTCLWFYAKLPQSCRLAFKGNALKESNNWKEELLLSSEQDKQVRQIGELSTQGLTGVDIVHDYLKHRISPLRRRAHLACNYTGPTDPTRDSDTDLSEEDIESMLSYLLDLKKTGQKEPPRRPTAPTSLIIASTNQKAEQHLDLLHVLSTLKTKNKTVEELTGPRSIRKSSAYKPLLPASPRRFTRQSSAPRKIVESPTPEIDSSPVQGHSDIEDEETLEARKTITTTASPDRGMGQKPIENPDEIEEGKRAVLLKPISSIIGEKRKSSSPGSQRKAKYSFISVMAKTRMSTLDNGCIKGTSFKKEAAAALNPGSPGLARHSHATSVEKGKKSALCLLANVVDQNKVAPDCPSNVPVHQHVRDSRHKKVDPALQSIAERDQHQEGIEESAPIQVPNPEEINSEAIWDKMVKVRCEYVSSSQTALSELLEQAKKLVIENKRMKNEHIVLEQQVKDLEENKRLLIDTTRKAEEEAAKTIAENKKLKDEIRDQKKMNDELNERNELTQGSLVQKSREVNRLEEEVAVLMKDKEQLQSRVSRANELLGLMTSTLGDGRGEGNRDS